jgi:Skp family chaperone for outer membrane proteins
MQPLLTRAAAAALILAVAGPVLAAPKPASAPVATQAAAPQTPPPPPVTHGPTIPGVCVFSSRNALGASSVGRSIEARMQQLRAQVAAELQAEKTTLQTDVSAFQAKQSTLTPEQASAQAQPLQQRYQALQAKASQRDRELEATFQDATGQVSQRLEPIVRTLYQQHTCSVLLNGEAVFYVKPDMDLTPSAVKALDAALPSITFDRKILPAQQPQQ